MIVVPLNQSSTLFLVALGAVKQEQECQDVAEDVIPRRNIEY
jgi:hypothetical protein